jgi:hypothetical protein
MYIGMYINAIVIFHTNPSLRLCCDQLVADYKKKWTII